MFNEKPSAKFFASLKETPENGTKKPSAKPGTKGRWPKGKANRVPRVKVWNYLKKVALFFRFERDIFADGAQVIGRIDRKTAKCFAIWNNSRIFAAEMQK